MFDVITSVILLFSNYDAIQTRQAILLSRQGAYERSDKVLQQVKYKDDIYHFYCFLNSFKMNKEKEARKHAEYLEYFAVNLPERYKALVPLMLDDMKTWKKDDLGDIARDMSHVKDRLSNLDAGKKTTKLQEDIVSKLDKLIKEQEDKKNKKDSGNGNKDSNDEEKQEVQQQFKKSPLSESQILDDSGKGTVNAYKMKKLMERWGSLPPREQARSLQQITAGMSARHREAIENYFKNIAIGSKK